MFSEDDLLDIHFGIHGDARAIQTRFGYVPIENRPVKYGGVVRCVTINKYEFMEQNIKEKSEWSQKAKEGHDITWISNLKPPGQIIDGEIKSSCYSILRRDPPEQPQPVPKRQRIEAHLDVGLSASQKTLSPSQSQESEPLTPVKTRGKKEVPASSPEEISHRRVVKAKRRSLSPNKEKEDVEIKDASATMVLQNGDQSVRRSPRLKSKLLLKGPSLMSLETDLDAYKDADNTSAENEQNNNNNTYSKTLQQSTLIDIDIINKSQDSSANNSSQALFFEDSADPMISSQESTPSKRKLARKHSTMFMNATPMVDIESFAGTSLHQNLTPMDVDQNTFQSGSTVTKSVVMKTLVSPTEDAAKSNIMKHDNGVINRDADTFLAHFAGDGNNETGTVLNTDQNQGSVGHFDTKLRTVRRSTFEIDFHELRVGKKLGAGAFGEVLKGTYRRVPVAIKILASQDKEAQKMFMKEVILLCKVQHPNVVKCFGACLKPPKLCFVMEFMPQSLANYIEKCKEAMPLKDLVTIAYYIALGIDFLHECKIIHRDLKPENILLDDDLTPKIADFGVSREKVQTAVMTKVGTPSYCAPEILNNEVYSEKADMYSYGMMLYAMVTGHAPFTDMNLTPLQIMMKAAVHNERPTIPSTCHKVLQSIITECWQQDPKARPSARDIMQQLRDNFGKHA
jgi:hypothetical protein